MKEVVEAIRKNNRFLITAHINPEGDSICSQLAVRELLSLLGKKAAIFDNDPVPEHYKFLPGAGLVLNSPDEEFEYDAVFVLDCPTIKRVGRVESHIEGKFLINIDHHISNENFGDINWVDPNASSVGEMIFRLFKELGEEPTREAALYLYIAILTDTGSFNYDNTSGVTHEIAGELLGYGLEPAVVSENIYERKSLSDIKLLGIALSTIKTDRTGQIASIEVTRRMLKATGADIAKSEGLVNYARSVDKVRVAVLFKEDMKDAGRINVSFRSKGDVDVNAIAAAFGGGGHVKAAGCSVNGRITDVKRKVLRKIEETLKREA